MAVPRVGGSPIGCPLLTKNLLAEQVTDSAHSDVRSGLCSKLEAF